MERAERTIGSWAAEPCGKEKVSAGETTAQVTAQWQSQAHWYGRVVNIP